MSTLPQKTNLKIYIFPILFLVLFFMTSYNSAGTVQLSENLTPTASITPTITPISVSQTGPECARSSFDVSVVGVPSFCIVWADNFQNETGFRTTLSYLNSGEIFVYEVEPNVTQVLVPEEHRPTTAGSQEECIRSRQVFEVKVIALINSESIEVGGVGGQGECWMSTPTP